MLAGRGGGWLPRVTVAGERLRGRYARIANQLGDLYANVPDPLSRMATAAALLHHKLPHFFWTGFYRLVNDEFVVGPYQGSLACMRLERGKGVCWAAVQAVEPILVEDVRAFEGHIACDSRSRSEVVVPVKDADGRVLVAGFYDSVAAAFTARSWTLSARSTSKV